MENNGIVLIEKNNLTGKNMKSITQIVLNASSAA